MIWLVLLWLVGFEQMQEVQGERHEQKYELAMCKVVFGDAEQISRLTLLLHKPHMSSGIYYI